MKQSFKYTPYFITAIIVMAVMLLITPACTKTKSEVVSAFENIDKIPTLHTTDVKTLISDSGITRYRIITAEWNMYDNAAEPYWFFPKGIYVERFDSLMQVDSTIKSDTAYFYKDKQVWELVGNVEVKNALKETFLTPQLFWEQRNKRIYSEKTIHIEQIDKIINGTGFESNETMTVYTIKKPNGIFPIKEKPDSTTTGNNT